MLRVNPLLASTVLVRADIVCKSALNYLTSSVAVINDSLIDVVHLDLAVITTLTIGQSLFFHRNAHGVLVVTTLSRHKGLVVVHAGLH